MAEQVILVEDDRDLREFLAESLEEAGWAVRACPTAEAALRVLEGGFDADLVVTDVRMPGMGGDRLLREVRSRRPEVNVIVITAFGTIDAAIEMVKAGAYDYLTKPFGTDELLLAVERALSDSRLRREVARLAREGPAGLPGFVGASRPMQELFELIVRVGPSPRPVLVTGESGSGKELVARALHHRSERQPFVVVNSAAIPETLLESELFGHEKGAFTGADRTRPGLFEEADGGTLFLDEIGELPVALQPKLLRVLEDGEVRRVGGTGSRRVDVRVVAATNRDLEEEVREGRFREDLFWRLNVVNLHVPPLRERLADVPLLAEHILSGMREGGAGPRRLSPEALALLVGYPWPGNVRELRNALERASTLARGEEIQPRDLPPRVTEAGRARTLVAGAARKQLALRDLERSYIEEVLQQTGGNKTRAARILGLDRKTLYRKLEEYRLGD